LVARVPRVDCPTHGVESAIVPWAEPRSRFTILFEHLEWSCVTVLDSVLPWDL
jgi:hypothetical protein